MEYVPISTQLERAAQEMQEARERWERLQHKYAEEVGADPGYKFFTFTANFKNGGRMGGRTYEYVGIRIDEAVYLSGANGDFKRWRDFVRWCRENLVQMSDIRELQFVDTGADQVRGVLLPEKP